MGDAKRRRARPHGDALVVRIVYNLGDGDGDRKVHDLLRMIEEHEPDVINLDEAAPYGPELAEVARRTGYKLVHDSSRPASDHIAQLFHPDVAIHGHKLRRLSVRKRVGHNTAGSKKSGFALPKYVLATQCGIRGVHRVEGCTHLVPSATIKGNLATRALHGVQVAGVALWVRTRRRAAAVGGDLNATRASGLLRRLFGAAVMVTDPDGTRGPRPIDWLAISHRHVPPLEGHTTGQALAGYSSDHDPVLFITRRKETRR